jgi:hypothetical protein
VHAKDLEREGLVAQLAWRWRTRKGGVVRRRGELQGLADRLDPPSILAGNDVTNYFLV